MFIRSIFSNYIWIVFSRDSSSLAEGLQEIQLCDIKLVVKLMCLCASGDMGTATTSNSSSNTTGGGPSKSRDKQTLSYLATAIATLARSDTSASKLLLNVCSKVCSHQFLYFSVSVVFACIHAILCCFFVFFFKFFRQYTLYRQHFIISFCAFGFSTL